MSETFSEAFYLLANPDVSRAVEGGAFASGREHYDRHGRGEGRLGSNPKPLLFFVHVPKTAGSTVNARLHQRLPAGRSHCEGFIHDSDAFRRSAWTCDWLSGHVHLDVADRLLRQAMTRPVRYFASVREPTAQVMSHYNWLIEIFHRDKQFYESHPANIKAISEAIRASRTDAASIVANLDRLGGLFLNTQARFVLGETSYLADKPVVERVLAQYELVAESPSQLLSAMIGVADDVGRENASRYHFDPEVFRSDQVRDFLARRNAGDARLFDMVTKGVTDG